MTGELITLADGPRCQRDMGALVSGRRAEFIGRIGGSDTDFLAKYNSKYKMIGSERVIRSLRREIRLIKEFNGYYDLDNKIDNAIDYSRTMIESYKKCDHLLVVGHDLLTEFFPNEIHEDFQSEHSLHRISLRDLCNSIARFQKSLTLYPYIYVESLLSKDYTFLKDIFPYLSGKRVLVLTPFSQSIEKNFVYRKFFFKNYKYPDFNLVTYQTPITYPGLPNSFYPDRNWNETTLRMTNEISGLDFDIALLSCGSYAMPLGIHIRNIGKIAIYMGGCLQLFFGIMGRRYHNSFFLDQINREYFINPVEWSLYKDYIEISDSHHKDGFGAYF